MLLQAQIFELLGFHRGRGACHHVPCPLIFGEGNDISNVCGSRQDHGPTIKAKGDAAVGRRAMFKRIQQETEFLLGLFRGKA